MAREPAITFRGALKVLGRHDRPWVDRLDKLLSGAILAAGPVGLSAVWGWVDQKNEAAGLLRNALDNAANRLADSGGLARHELVVAAHTTIVLSAFFDTLRERLGKRYDQLELTDAEKLGVAAGDWSQYGESLVRRLYTVDVPAPSAVRGFEETVPVVERWAANTAKDVAAFTDGLVTGPVVLASEFSSVVAQRYRSYYLTMATTVGEFKVWMDLGEHAATRSALSRLENLLTSRWSAPRRDLRARLAKINQAELDRPIIETDTDGYGSNAVFPAVQDIFITPRYRVGEADRQSRISDERWWQERSTSRGDLDDVLARHFSTASATRLPLLLLGQPGAGKSLLMKVLSARLPESTYTVLRVPLRRVDADAGIAEQIQQGLNLATNGTMAWSELSEQSADAIRVVLLDGLDELLQATAHDRGGYLAAVVEFQRIEAAQGRPVAVVVTSRTLVADRVRVPVGTPVVKLEDFDDTQISEWIEVWNEVNTGTGPMTQDLAMAHGDLARQPLLLLMLTLYFADPDDDCTDGLMDDELSTSTLYERLLITYARREITKQEGRVLPDSELADAVRAQLTRLSIAALGMFNRGRQSILETELSADLAALGEPAPLGSRLLGEFFFVHAPEAVSGGVQRGYEFLHATFAEYLVARRVVEVLSDVAEGAFGRRRYHEPEDELLYALLSHQPLAVQAPIIAFVRDQFHAMPETESNDVVRTLEILVAAYRNRRPPARYLDYRPLPSDAVRSLAAYSANLVLMWLCAPSTGPKHVTTLWPRADGRTAWQPLVRVWAAGLDAESYRAMLSAIELNDGRLKLVVGVERDSASFDAINSARLSDDSRAERILRYGHAVIGDYFYNYNSPSWSDVALSALVNNAVGEMAGIFPEIPDGVPAKTAAGVARVACGVLAVHCVEWDVADTENFLSWLMELPMPEPAATWALAMVAYAHPAVINRLRAQQEDRWAPEWCDALQVAALEGIPKSNISEVANYLRTVLPGIWPIGP
jgi:hypothetical protein